MVFLSFNFPFSSSFSSLFQNQNFLQNRKISITNCSLNWLLMQNKKRKLNNYDGRIKETNPQNKVDNKRRTLLPFVLHRIWNYQISGASNRNWMAFLFFNFMFARLYYVILTMPCPVLSIFNCNLIHLKPSTNYCPF